MEYELIKKSGSDVLASSWSIADVGGIYENAISLVNLPKRFEKDFLTLDIPRCFMFSEENFPAKGTAGTADIPKVERLESFGVLVEILPKSGHEMMISNPEDFTKILSGFLNQPFSSVFDKSMTACTFFRISLSASSDTPKFEKIKGFFINLL